MSHVPVATLQWQLDRLQESIARGSSREESLLILEEVRGTASCLSVGTASMSLSGSHQSPHRASLQMLQARSPTPAGLPHPIPAPSTALFRADGDTARYQTATAALYDPLLSIESAFRRHYGEASGGSPLGGGSKERPLAWQRPASPSGISPFLTEILTSPVPLRSSTASNAVEPVGVLSQLADAAERHPLARNSESRRHDGERKNRFNKREIKTNAGKANGHSGSLVKPVSYGPQDTTEIPPPDRRDLETPFPFHSLAAGSAGRGPHGTLLERLFALLRFGKGTTTAYLLDTMNGDTQAAVLSESSEPGVRCMPFAERLVRELTTYIMVKDTAIPRERTWEGDAFNRKVEDRARRFPLLAASGGGRLPDIDPRLDFAVDRPLGVLEALRGFLPSAITCSSSCGKASKEQFAPPARGRACVVFATDEWIEVSIEPWACCVTSYALASVCPITGGSPPRNWVLEAAYGRGNWLTLREHTNDESISKLKNYSLWDVPANLRTVVANRFRVRRTGLDGRNGTTLQVAHLEVYGRFMACWPNGIGSTEARSEDFGAAPAASAPPTRFVAPTSIPLPPEPVGKIGKKKKK